MNSDIPTTSGITFPYVNAHIYAAGFDFLFPYIPRIAQRDVASSESA